MSKTGQVVTREGLGWWWLSFADAGKPKGQQFLGACVVRGTDMLGAIQNAWDMAINPGGEALGSGPIPAHLLPDECWRNRLLSKNEATQQAAEMDRKARVG